MLQAVSAPAKRPPQPGDSLLQVSAGSLWLDACRCLVLASSRAARPRGPLQGRRLRVVARQETRAHRRSVEYQGRNCRECDKPTCMVSRFRLSVCSWEGRRGWVTGGAFRLGDGAVRLGLHRSDPGVNCPKVPVACKVCIKCCVCDKRAVIIF